MALRDGRARRRAGAPRDAQTRGHYFCSEPRTAPRPGPLIKPPRSRPPPPAGRMRSTCVGPARAPAPAAPPLPASPAEGSAAHPEPGSWTGAAAARARERHSPSDPAPVTFLLAASLSAPRTHRARLTRPCDAAVAAAARCFVSRAPCPCSCSSKDPSRAGASRPSQCPSLCLCPQDSQICCSVCWKGGRVGISQSSKDTRDSLWTVVSWGNRFRPSCPTVIGSFGERGQGTGRGSQDKRHHCGPSCCQERRPGVAGAGADRKPQASAEAERAFQAGDQAKAARED